MTPKTILFCLALLAIAVVPLFALAGFSLSAIALHVAPLLMVGMTIGSQLLVKDYGARITKTLPASNTVAYTAAIDLGHDATGRVPVGTEILIEAPALAVGELSNAATMTYVVQHDTDSAFGTAVSLYGTVLTQTGASGAGAAAATKRVALPSDCKRYIRVAATANTNLDASAKSMAVNVMH